MAENIGRSVNPLVLVLASILSALLFPAAPVEAASIDAATQNQSALIQEYPYYVEFRVAVDGVYGHSYIAYGRLDSFGGPATAAYADIHPTGNFLGMVLGHFFAMHAATTPEKDTLGHNIASRFRQPLTVAEYDELKSVVARIRAANHSWSILAYNCNDFVADVARGMGMQIPTTLSLPYLFIPRLQAINERMLRPTRASIPATEIRQTRAAPLSQ